MAILCVSGVNDLSTVGVQLDKDGNVVHLTDGNSPVSYMANGCSSMATPFDPNFRRLAQIKNASRLFAISETSWTYDMHRLKPTSADNHWKMFLRRA